MTDVASIVDRLAALPNIKDVPRPELEWIAAHGQLDSFAAGTLISHQGVPLDCLWIVLTGKITFAGDRGAGPRQVIEWGPGDVSGQLPYSRMVAPPGDARAGADTEALRVHRDNFPEMIRQCPAFVAHTVHVMVDRARRFRTSDLQDEKMLALGKLAAGLAHEINNPASATTRGAKQLRTVIAEADEAARALGSAGLSESVRAAVEKVRIACLAHDDGSVRSPMEQADREDAIADWLSRHHADPSYAVPLAETPLTLDGLDTLARAAPGPALDTALHWIATACTAESLVHDIEDAATRIHDLVAAIKRFTYMDTASGPEPVDIGAGLKDTVRVLAAKARARGASVSVDVPVDLPRAHAIGSEMNQVWLNLLDNALDAVTQGGHVTLRARAERGRIEVRITDDGAGIPSDVLPQIFDPFFTTKPPGQGTGLGLEITRQLVQQSQGTITVESQPGHTEFCISLAEATAT